MSLYLLLLSKWREEHNLMDPKTGGKKFKLDAKWQYSAKS